MHVNVPRVHRTKLSASDRQCAMHGNSEMKMTAAESSTVGDGEKFLTQSEGQRKSAQRPNNHSSPTFL